MDAKRMRRMRRLCADLVADLRLPVPASPAQLINALCGRMGQQLGTPVHYRQVAFPPDTVSGLWVATAHANYVLSELHTSQWHQVGIVAHEFYHMLAGHGGVVVKDADTCQRLLAPSLEPSLAPDAVARIVAARGHCTEHEEEELEEEVDADLFSTILRARVGRWIRETPWTVPEHATALVGRLEASLNTLRAA